MSPLIRFELPAHRRRIPRALHLAAAGLAVAPLIVPAQSTRVVITPATGYSIAWDGNNGGFSSPEGGAKGPDNDASAAKGASTFASSSFQPGGIHDHVNINDGFYGNSSSWIADFEIADRGQPNSVKP